MAVKTIAFMLPWVDPLSANSNLYNAGVIARIETSIADRAITAGKALEINANIFDQQLNSTDSPTFAGLTVDTNTLFVDSTNNRVGLGTTSPDETLHVVGTIIADEANVGTQSYTGVNSLQVTGSGTSGLLIHNSSTTGTGYVTFGDGAVAGRIAYSHNGNYMNFTTGSSERMRVDSTGLGIGTTDPATPLHTVRALTNAYTTSIASTGGNPSGLEVATWSNSNNSSTNNKYVLHAWQVQAGIGQSNVFGRAGLVRTGASSGAFVWQLRNLVDANNTSEAMRLTDDGYLGIGTTSPLAGIHAAQPDNSLIAKFERTGGNASEVSFFGSANSMYQRMVGLTGNAVDFIVGGGDLHINTSGSTRITVLDSGNVGFSTTNPQETLHVNGGVRIAGLLQFDGNFRNISQASSTALGMALLGGTTSSNGASLAAYGGTHSTLAGNLYLTTGGAASVGDLIVRNSNGTGFVEHMRIKQDGRISMTNLPTNSSGLSSGDLWNDGGTLKIA